MILRLLEGIFPHTSSSLYVPHPTDRVAVECAMTTGGWMFIFTGGHGVVGKIRKRLAVILAGT